MKDVSIIEEEQIVKTLNPPNLNYQNDRTTSFSFSESLNVINLC